MLERIGAVSIIVGTVLGGLGFCWLILRAIRSTPGKSTWNRLRPPLLMLVVSGLMTGLPIGINSALTHLMSLGPLNTIVAGERHLTLTGWDRNDYSVIATQTDTVVLQMANADVTDETLTLIVGMKQLRELDLNNTQVTDSGLATIAALPHLQDLRLSRTKISDSGFRQHLLEKESLVRLELIGTSVASKTIREWKAANPDRKALH